MSESTTQRINFIDWMKCLGMFMIVYGHVASKTIEFMTFPIYPKQLGVAFFVFVIGWYLAKEKRDRALIVYNRLFQIFLYGIGFAIFMSIVIFIIKGDLNESNYLPFMLGANVLFDSFPANPTTWYIGTYIHLILIWAIFLHRIRIKAWMICAWLIVEIMIRAVLMPRGLYRAYMIFPNWGGVLLLGMYFGQKDRADCSLDIRFPIYLLGYMVMIFLWTILTKLLVGAHAFPFKELGVSEGFLKQIVRSVLVSSLYVTHTWFMFELTRRIPAARIVRFFSRNTLLIFIAHMPLWYAIDVPLRKMLHSYPIFVCAAVTVLFVGLGAASEITSMIIKPVQIRDWIWNNILCKALAFLQRKVLCSKR